MRCNRLAILAMPPLLFLASCCGSEKPIDLRLNLEEGETYGHLITVEQDAMMMRMSAQVGVSMCVKGIAGDGTTEMEATCDMVRVSADAGEAGLKFDSTKPPRTKGPLQTLMSALVGSKFTMILDSKGGVKEVSGLKEIAQKAAAALPAGLEQASMEKAIRDQFGLDGMKQMLGYSFGFYPPRPVKPGDSWQSTHKMSAGSYAAVEVETTYTFKGREAGRVLIEAKGVITPGKEGKRLEVAGIPVSISLSGTQEGTMEVDERTGLVVASTITQNLAGGIEVGGQRVPMNMKSTITVGEYGRAQGTDKGQGR